MQFDVFISYSRKDIDEANKLCNEFDRLGIRYWIDRNIQGSANFLSEITQKIRQCKVVIFIASDSSANSEWTQREILFALKHKKNIIPYRIGEFSFETNDELDFVFTNVQWLENRQQVVLDVYNLCYNNNKTEIISNNTKKTHKYLISLIIAIILLLLFGIIFWNYLHKLKLENNNLDINYDNTQAIIEEFEKQPELPISKRVDIVDLINTYMQDNSWSTFSKFTKKQQLVPLSGGLEDNEHQDMSPYKVDFISKLCYKGDNIDSDIFGKSLVQEITLYGARAGAGLLAIDNGCFSQEIAWNIEGFIEDLGFSPWMYIEDFTVNYYIYKKDKYWLLEKFSGGSAGNNFTWLISDYKENIFNYIKYVDNKPNDIDYLKLAFSSSVDESPRRFGWGDRVSIHRMPDINGDIKEIEVEHNESGNYTKIIYTFNERGDVIYNIEYDATGRQISTWEYEYYYQNNEVKMKYNGKDEEEELGVENYISTENYYRYDYKYDKEGNIIEETEYLLGDKDPRIIIEYKYDKKNNTIIKKSEKYSNSKYILYTYTYNNQGNIVKEVIEEKGEQTKIINYEYDERGNIISLTQTSGLYFPSSHTTYNITYR